MTSDPTPATRTAQALTDLKAGDHAVVVRMNEDDHALMIRLKTMGIHEGRAIRLVRAGSRIIINCGGTQIGLSATIARHIRVALTP